GEIRLDFEGDPAEKAPIHLDAAAPDQELAAEPAARQRPRVLLRGIEIGLDATAQLDLEEAVRRLKKGPPLLNPNLNRRGLFFLGFFLQSVILLLVDLPTLLHEIEDLLQHWLVLGFLAADAQRSHPKPDQHSHQYTQHEMSHCSCLSIVR